jgi:hypothetical protein
MDKKYTYTEAQINLISEALNDADSFYDCFDDDNDGRGAIIRRGLEALSQSDSPCDHAGEHCDGAEFCNTCNVQIFSGYVYGNERYCNDHKPAAWDAEVAAMSSDEFNEQGDMYWTQWEIDDIFCDCPTDCPCRPAPEALQALYDADRAREGIA